MSCISGPMQWSWIPRGRWRRKWGGPRAGTGWFRDRSWTRRMWAVEGRGHGVVPERVMDGTEGGPRVEKAGRVWGGPGAGTKRISRVGRLSQKGE